MEMETHLPNHQKGGDMLVPMPMRGFIHIMQYIHAIQHVVYKVMLIKQNPLWFEFVMGSQPQSIFKTTWEIET